MDDAELERILRAIRTPLSGAPTEVVKKLSRGARSRELSGWRGCEAKASERCRTKSAARPGRSGVVERAEDAVRRWIPEAEVKRLRRAIRTSFCNSPHKKKYWTALLEMYGMPECVYIGRSAVNPSLEAAGNTSCVSRPGRCIRIPAGGGHYRRS